MAIFLKATWKNLIMANFAVDPGVLLPYLPARTEIDSYNGNVYVSLVAFLFSNTRVLGLPVPFHINFEEVNLRFYVRYNDRGIWKRGVVFIKEIVPRAAISLVANVFYREPYCTMPMKHQFIESNEELSFDYQWRFKNNWQRLKAVTEVDECAMVNESEVHFIAEHYWGYSRFNTSTTFEYEVAHVPWGVYTVKDYVIECDFKNIYGEQFSFLDKATPISVFVAKGSSITVGHKRRV